MNQAPDKIKSIGWFFYDSKNKMVCLHKRNDDAPESKNTWDYFGGAREEKDKTAEDALRRELQEELGMNFEKNKISLLSTNGKNIYVIFASIHGFRKMKLGEGAGFAWLYLDYAIKHLENLSLDARNQLQKFETETRQFGIIN